MSKDRREGDLARVKVGDTLGARPYRGRGWVFATVERITPTGQMVLSNGARLDPKGEDMGQPPLAYDWRPVSSQMLREDWGRSWLSSLKSAESAVAMWVQRGDHRNADWIEILLQDFLHALEVKR